MEDKDLEARKTLEYYDSLDWRYGVATVYQEHAMREEPLMSELRDPSIYIKEQLDREQRREYEACCQWFKDNFKPSQAEMMIAIILDGYSVNEYARKIGDHPNNVSKRYNRAKKKLEKIYDKRPISASPVAIQWEGRHSRKQKGGN